MASGALPAFAAGAPAAAVEIRNFAFGPRALAVRAGRRVTWANVDEEPHTVTSAGGTFKSSAALDTGDTCTVTFARQVPAPATARSIR